MSERLLFDNLNNTRDLGGMKTMDGRKIRKGKLIRSGSLFAASETDKKILSETVDIIVDFRTSQELYEKPDPYLPGVYYHHIPIISSWTAGVTWEAEEEISEEELFQQLQKIPSMARDYMCRIYQSFASNQFYLAQYRKFIDLLLSGTGKAILWHCTAGKDRAGFASVLAEALLGVDKKTVTEDYLKTQIYMEEEMQQIIARVRKRYPEPGAVTEEAMGYLFGAKQEFIDAVYEKMEALYGTFDAFAKDALKLTRTQREQLKDMYLE